MLLLFGAGICLKYASDVCSADGRHDIGWLVTTKVAELELSPFYDYHLPQWFPTHAWTVLVLLVGPRSVPLCHHH